MTAPRSLRWAAGSFRALLRILPKDVRDQHGQEMEDLFFELLREAHRRSGARGVVAVWIRSVMDLALSRGVEQAPRRGRLRLPSLPFFLDTLLHDLRLSTRNLLAKPGHTTVAVGSLAVGMSITIGIFTFADAVLWKEWEFHEADRVVQVFERRDQYLLPSWPVFREIQENVDLLDGVLASQLDLFSLGVGKGAEMVVGERVSEDYFGVLGVPPEMGRYPAAQDAVGGGILPVVISHNTWEVSFGMDQDIIGREVRLNGYSGTVVAVAPDELDGTKWGVSAELWVPTAAWAEADGWENWEDDRNLNLTVMARMRDGANLDAVNAALASLAEGLAETQPGAYQGLRLEATDRLRGDMGPEIGITADIIAVVAILGGFLVLLVGCGNVAGLQLARGVLRTKEVAVRFALGASRGRVIRQLFTEALVLAGLATLAGLFLSRFGIEAILTLLPTFDFRVNFPTSPGPRGVVFSTILAVVAVLASGLAPARQLARADLAEAMKSEGRGSPSGARNRLMGMVAVGMVGVSMLALVLAGVFSRTLDRSRTLSPGFAVQDRLMAVVPLRLAGYQWPEAARFFEDFEGRLLSLPGVVHVGYATGIPLGESWTTASVYSVDRAYLEGDPGVRAFRSSVSDDYFRAMGTRIVRGRAFRPQDGPDGPWVAIVNEELAEKLWPGEDPLGRRIRFGLGEHAEAVEVVGVAEAGAYYMAGEDPEPAVFASFRQWPQAQAMVVLETDGDPWALVPSLRNALSDSDPNVPLQRPRTSEAHFRDALWLYRLGAGIGGTVSLISLLLAGVGLYGVMSFTLGARRQEMGIRRALGAGSPEVLRLAVGSALRLTLIGLVLGAGLSLLAGMVLRVTLVGVARMDAAVFGFVTVLVLSVGVLSGLVPGWLASRVNPGTVLKGE